MTGISRHLQLRAFARTAAFLLLSHLVATGAASTGGSLASGRTSKANQGRHDWPRYVTCHLFTTLLNNPQAAGDMAGVKVVAAYPGGSDDLPLSHDRVKGFTKQLRGMGVEIVNSIEELLPKVDAIMLESVDGRPHLEQAKPVILAGKPLFVDKPAASSLAGRDRDISA